MAQIQLQGLQGLRGLNSRQLSEYRDRLYDLGLINVHTPILVVHDYMDTWAKRDEFKEKYLPKIISLNNPTINRAINEVGVDNMDVNLMDYLVKSINTEEEFEKRYSPYVVDHVDKDGHNHYKVKYIDNAGREHYEVDPIKGIGDELTYLKYSQMTPEGKRALLNSDYKIPSQINKENKETSNKIKEWGDYILYLLPLFRFLDALHAAIETREGVKGSIENFNKLIKEIKESKDSEEIKKLKLKDLLLETLKHNPAEGSSLNPMREGFNLAADIKELYSTKENQAILDRIMDEDLKRRRGSFGEIELLKLNELNNLSKNKIDNMFNASIHLEDGYGNELFKIFFNANDNSVKGFDTEEKKKYLAMQQTLQENMDPLSAHEALINYAKDYISDHTGKKEYVGKLANDILLSAASYSADKVNGLVGLGKMVDGWLGNKYSVYIDLEGNAYNRESDNIQFDKLGAFVLDEDGNRINLHKAEMTSSQLFAQGKGTDGKDKHWLLNNKFWDNVELWGTTDEKMLKIYEKAGYSANKVIYKAGDETDILYETAKMTSFGLADGVVTAAMAAFSGGAGAIGKVATAGSKLGRIATSTASFIENAARWGGAAASTAGIANAYARGTYLENVMNNLNKLLQNADDNANALFVDKYTSDEKYKKQIDKETQKEFEKLKYSFDQLLRASGTTLSKELYEELKNALFLLAADNVAERHVELNKLGIINDDKYFKAVNEATKDATIGALVAGVTDAIKYLPVNFAGHRKFLFSTRSKLLSDAQRSVIDRVKNSANKLYYEPTAWLASAGKKAKTFAGKAVKQAWGGAWTNYTDELHTAGGRRLNDDKFAAYLDGEYNGDAVNTTYSLGDAISSYWEGARDLIPVESSLKAGLVGALGTLFSAAPNFEGIGRLAFSKESRNAFRENIRTLLKGNNKNPYDPTNNAPESRRAALLSLANTFLNNGVLQEYEAHKLAERDIMRNILLVNSILSLYNDFLDVEDAIALDLAEMDVNNEKDARVIDFLLALKSIYAINKLATEENSETTPFDALFAKSQALLNAKLGWEDIQKLANGEITEEDAENYLSQYYNINKDKTRSEENDAKAMQEMQNNAKALLLVSTIYSLLLQEVQLKNEERKNEGKDPINLQVAEKLIQRKALSSFIEDEINDIESEATGREITDYDEKEMPIAAYGSKRNIKQRIKNNSTSIDNLKKREDSIELDITKAKKEYEDGIKEALFLDEDIDADTYEIPIDEAAKLPKELYDKLIDLKTKYDNSKLLKQYLGDIRGKLEDRNASLLQYLDDESSKDKHKALSAEEIISLDPESRAYMLNPKNRELYSKAQLREIDKATAKLNAKTSGGNGGGGGTTTRLRNTPVMRSNLDERTTVLKLIDLADLMRHKRANDKAYEMMESNPEAALYLLDMRKEAYALENAWALIDGRAQSIDKWFKGLRDHSLKELGKIQNLSLIDRIKLEEASIARKLLRVLNPFTLLYLQDNIDKFPHAKEWQSEIGDAIEWGNLTTNIQRSIDNNADLKPEEKERFKEDMDVLLDSVDTREEAILLIKRNLDIENESFNSAKPRNKGHHAFMAKYYNTLLNDILGVDNLESITNESTKEDLDNRDADNRSKEQNVIDKIKKAEKISVIKDDEEGGLHIGEYKIQNSTITTDYSKDGKKYSIPTFQYSTLTFDGDKKAAWNISGKELSDLGISLVDILGTKDSWANPELWDKVAKELPKGGLTIDLIIVNSRGEVSVNLGTNDTLTLEGLSVNDNNAAKKIFSHIANGIKPEDFVERQKRQVQKKDEGPKLNNNEDTGLSLPQEGYMEDTNQDGDMVEEMQDDTNPVTNALVEQAIIGEPNIELLKSPDIQELGLHQEGPKPVELITLPKDTTNNGNNLPINDATNMLGNPFYLYEVEALKDSGLRKLIRRIVKKLNSPFEKANKWLDKNNIKLQEIIDNELHLILKHTSKVHFLKFKMLNHNEFDDHLLSDLCPLCVEYTLAVSDIHDSSRGGVFTSNGKQYLMIGFAGFADANKTLGDAYRAFLYQRKVEAKQYLDAHPNERAHVNPNIYTEVLYLTSGRLVGEIEEDTERTVRPITELLDPNNEDGRNPQHLTLQSMKWMIQEGTLALKINFNGDEIYHTPIDAPSNKGAVFAMIPGCNGHYLPVYINPVTYGELRDSTLKSLILELLIKLTDPNHAVRDLAIRNLLKMLVFNDEKNIWIGKPDLAVVSIKNGAIERKFNLGGANTNIDTFLLAVEDAGFRVNITLSVLQDNSMLELYAEAGALDTDIAMLGATNASYSIYLIGEFVNGKWVEQGKPIKTNLVNNNIQGPDVTESEEKRLLKAGQSVRYGGKFYRRRGEDWATINRQTNKEERIKDPIMKKLLDLTSYILKNQLKPTITKKISTTQSRDYYILSSDKSNPKVLEVNPETSHVIDMDASSAILIIEESLNRATQNAKNTAAKLAIQNTQNTLEGQLTLVGDMEDITLDLGEPLSDEEMAKQITGLWGDSGVPDSVEDADLDLGKEGQEERDKKYYVIKDEELLGPFTIEQLSSMDIMSDTPIWTEGMPDWNTADKVAELQSLLHNNKIKELQYPKPTSKNDGGINSTKLGKTAAETGVHSVRSIIRNRDLRNKLSPILLLKGLTKRLSMDVTTVNKWLLDHLLPTDNISDVDTWLDDIENCR